MKTNIYYLTRTYLPELTGGTIMRAAAVKYLKQNSFNVIVVTPNYNNKKIFLKDNVIRFPLDYDIKKATKLEKYGLYEDYLDPWIKKTYKYLKKKINGNDIIFATTGGELGNIKLGSMLKKNNKCKYIINYRDPIDFTNVNGMKINNSFHINRDNKEKKYIENADLIITSCKKNQISLQTKYVSLSDKIKNNYYGYVKKININQKKKFDKLRIAYSGYFNDIRSPEILALITRNIKNVEVYYIGDSRKYTRIRNIKRDNIKMITYLEHNKYLNYMINNIDVGFVSLTKDYFGACFPSKIYEYINLGIPILAALPEGDAMDFINWNGFGYAFNYNDKIGLRNAVKYLNDPYIYNNVRTNIINNRDFWSMENKIKEVVNWIRKI